MSGSTDCSLELALDRETADEEFSLNLRINRGLGQTDKTIDTTIRLPLSHLAALLKGGDLKGYTRILTEAFWAQTHIRDAFVEIRSVAEIRNVRLKFRLRLRTPKAKSVKWELLQEPVGELYGYLAQSERRLLSRYMDAMPAQLHKPRGKLKSVVLVADPKKLRGKDLPPINVQEQIDAVIGSLSKGTECNVLRGPEANRTKLMEKIAEGVDIVYIVCHGHLSGRTALLALEGRDQEAEEVDCEALAGEIANNLCPLLFVFGSCESAGGTFSEEVLETAAAWLTSRGVPAVVGMHGVVSQATCERFAKRLFAEIIEHGQIEQAMSAARLAVADRPDWWMPLLLLTKEDGQLWPLNIMRQDFVHWDLILDEIDMRRCTPILGSEVVPLFSNHNFARHLIESSGGRILSTAADELAWVAQQFRILVKERTVERSFFDFLHRGMGVADITVRPKERCWCPIGMSRWAPDRNVSIGPFDRS